MRSRALAGILVCSLVLPVATLPGCSTKSQSSTTTETIEYPAGSTLPGGEIAGEDTPVRITRESTTVTEKDSGCGGVVGCTAKITWEIVKLPFRILGFLLDIII